MKIVYIIIFVSLLIVFLTLEQKACNELLTPININQIAGDTPQPTTSDVPRDVLTALQNIGNTGILNFHSLFNKNKLVVTKCTVDKIIAKDNLMINKLNAAGVVTQKLTVNLLDKNNIFNIIPDSAKQSDYYYFNSAGSFGFNTKDVISGTDSFVFSPNTGQTYTINQDAPITFYANSINSATYSGLAKNMGIKIHGKCNKQDADKLKFNVPVTGTDPNIKNGWITAASILTA